YRIRLRTVAYGVALVAFFFGMDQLRTRRMLPPGMELVTNSTLIGESFDIFTNPLPAFDDGRATARPPVDSYVNDFSRLIPSYIFSTHFDVSTWMLSEFYPGVYEAGGGKAYGFNTEAMFHWG